MASITITIPDAQVQRVLDAFSHRYGYQDQIDGAPNPQTKVQFAKQQVALWIKRETEDYERAIRIAAAEAAAIALDAT
jgi:hypothetical protein